MGMLMGLLGPMMSMMGGMGGGSQASAPPQVDTAAADAAASAAQNKDTTIRRSLADENQNPTSLLGTKSTAAQPDPKKLTGQ